ncbi:MAG: porphobilinogen synthase [Henriciella sp.]|jgi:porphobilinogen synthase|uniref:porphobilinogen synthase n=1 Tax=Henriciella sp. TaxID=1968823 RepID=UPI000C103513|nr:porphobilinogen synthase [Henriciella sp.]MAN75562.1 porphobilinogen synthase [Henriciella sp.]MBF34037.1 porphobilinogen synthase [Hyphomonadaceae bacterium]MBK73897.1 porphobilinogen synthase [Henriciella sp.]PHR81767.1 MAG: porphobilinogen synthase [Henriciella sp.]|tara:strand:+ start:25721 stop:26725 length:1005 start_codon:yes stop_codon:yes gene_type:complete
MTSPFPQTFPATRLRRLRHSGWIRELSGEHALTPSDIIWSMIVHDGEDAKVPVGSMPGLDRLNVDEAAKAARRARDLGIPAIAIFPHIDPSRKDETGSEALNKDGLIPTVIKAMKDAAPEVGVICDVALDPFTIHGHDGVVDEAGYVRNDDTVELLRQQAVVQAEAGADIVAPSDMMDGRVGAIRTALEEGGFSNTMILSYAAKYASGFYGPYRDAIGSASALKGDKKTYQQNPANSDEALREVAMDIAEGADLVMVKPGLPYLDIIRRVSETFAVPTIAFQVSGEYAQIKAAGQNGWIDEERVMMETLLCFKRAGAAGVITYFAEAAAQILND